MNHFYLYPYCEVAAGRNKSCIINYSDKKSFSIANDLANFFLLKRNSFDIVELERPEREEILDSLVEKDLGFYSNCKMDLRPIDDNIYETDLFLVVNLSNEFIDYLNEIILVDNFKEQIAGIEIILDDNNYSLCDQEFLSSIVKSLSFVRILLPFSIYQKHEMEILLKKNRLIGEIIVYDCSDEFNEEENKSIVKTNNSLEGIYDTSLVLDNSIEIDIENLKIAHNSMLGLNGILYINKNLEIYRFYNHTAPIGKLLKQDISSLLQLSSINMTIDEVERCKECDKRYVCIDHSEIFTKNKLNFKKNTCEYFQNNHL